MSRSPTATAASGPDAERYYRLSSALRGAERSVRILRSIAWGPEVRTRFFAAQARELPRVSYPGLDPVPVVEQLTAVRAELDPGHPVDQWLARTANAIEHGARMLAAMGTPAFFDHSRMLYGAPSDPLADGMTASIELARRLGSNLGTFAHSRCLPPTRWVAAADVARALRVAVDQHFGAEAPRVELVDNLSANALARHDVIRVRRGGRFTDRDAAQLIHHEAFIHVATSHNGHAQVYVPLLAAGHAGTTRTQEGLAVFAEMMSGTMDPDRLRRLADRVLGIQMAIDGADFIEVYRDALDRGLEPDVAFEATRRIFRGGVLTGGAPFTKDVTYLGGLLRVHNFLRAAAAAERPDCIELLFCGKLDIRDVPAIGHLAQMGLCLPPRFLPPWVSDMRFLLSYLSYSAFLNQMDLGRVQTRIDGWLAETPEAPWSCAWVPSEDVT